MLLSVIIESVWVTVSILVATIFPANVTVPGIVAPVKSTVPVNILSPLIV